MEESRRVQKARAVYALATTAWREFLVTSDSYSESDYMAVRNIWLKAGAVWCKAQISCE